MRARKYYFCVPIYGCPKLRLRANLWVSQITLNYAVNNGREMRVKSYVLRQGRLTKAQANAIELHWAEFGIDYRDELLDLDALFNRVAPRVLDIGTGMGETTLKLAQEHPENDYLAVEVHRPGIGRLLYGIAEYGLTNVRVINHDAVDVVNWQIPEESMTSIYINFPDPWPKKRHHKRRLVQPGFINRLTSRMKLEGQLYLATDSRNLAEYMLAVCDAETGLINLAGFGNFSPRPLWRPLTKFEQRGLDLNNQGWEMIYCRRLEQ